MSTSIDLSRRRLFKSAGSASALVLAMRLPLGRASTSENAEKQNPNTFIRIARDNTVTVLAKHHEMGQGVTTGLATIVAEELDADWGQMRFEFAPADSRLYNNLFYGSLQLTASSNSIANSWKQLRKAGATLRAMLVEAAAAKWQVPVDEVGVKKGQVFHQKSSKSLCFGQLATVAARLPLPKNISLKDPQHFTLIGQPHLPRLDVPEKITGKALYSIDIKRPGQLTAAVVHPPKFGAVVKNFEATEAKRIPGVVSVVQIPSGVAVLAKDSWTAIKARDALRVNWDFSSAENRSTEEILAEFHHLADKPDKVSVSRGNIEKGLAAAKVLIEAEFTFPYLAHAPLEPMGAVIEPGENGVTVWAGTQSQTLDQVAVAEVLGLRPEQVTINTLFSGGSFGRRADPRSDYLVEAANIFKAIGGDRPIHLLWTREDDMTAGRYRPMSYHRVRAGITEDGRIAGWDHIVVGKSITEGTVYESAIRNGVDGTMVYGLINMPYVVSDFRTRVRHSKEGVPVLWWRAVSHTHTAHVVEVMLDELANAASQDPVSFRNGLLGDNERAKTVLMLAAEKADWEGRLTPGQGKGIALHHSHGTQVAAVAQVNAQAGSVRVERIVVAVDCGIALNPDNIRSQFEGGVGFVLSAILRNQITMRGGEVEQMNFDTYQPTRIGEMPVIEVHIVPSTASPTGVGEPAVTCIGPAVINAIFNATGKRYYSLPIGLPAA